MVWLDFQVLQVRTVFLTQLVDSRVGLAITAQTAHANNQA